MRRWAPGIQALLKINFFEVITDDKDAARHKLNPQYMSLFGCCTFVSLDSINSLENDY
jgi:hypothetical protein